MNEMINARHRPLGRHADRFRDLLARYPDTTDAQVAEMIAIYGRLSMLELALLSADDSVAKPLHDFLHEQGHRAAGSWRDVFVFVLTFLGGFALIVMLIIAVMG